MMIIGVAPPVTLSVYSLQSDRPVGRTIPAHSQESGMPRNPRKPRWHSRMDDESSIFHGDAVGDLPFHPAAEDGAGGDLDGGQGGAGTSRDSPLDAESTAGPDRCRSRIRLPAVHLAQRMEAAPRVCRPRVGSTLGSTVCVPDCPRAPPRVAGQPGKVGRRQPSGVRARRGYMGGGAADGVVGAGGAPAVGVGGRSGCAGRRGGGGSPRRARGVGRNGVLPARSDVISSAPAILVEPALTKGDHVAPPEAPGARNRAASGPPSGCRIAKCRRDRPRVSGLVHGAATRPERRPRQSQCPRAPRALPAPIPSSSAVSRRYASDSGGPPGGCAIWRFARVATRREGLQPSPTGESRFELRDPQTEP